MDSDFRRKMREKYGLEDPNDDGQDDHGSVQQDKVDIDDVAVSTREEYRAELGTFGKCARTWLTVVNVIFFLCGAVLIVYGVLNLESPGSLGELEVSLLSKGTTVAALTVASAIALLALFGLFGARLESLCFLKVYAIILGILILVQAILGALVGTGEVNMSSIVAGAWEVTDNDVRLDLQNELDCCGLYSFNDTYAGLPCPTNNGTIPTNTTMDPCLDILVEDYFQVYGAFGIAFLVIGGLQVLTFLMSLGYYLCVRKKKASVSDQPLLLNSYRD